MRKILVVALVLTLCPLCAASAEESQVAPCEILVPSTDAAPGQPAESPDLGLVPAPVFVSACTDLCYGEFSSCKLDCRFNPYTGCLQDCNNELNACLAAC